MRLHLSIITLSALLLPATAIASITQVPHLNPETDLFSGRYVAIMQTSKGVIRLRLFANSAPLATTNFITLAKAGYYDGITFHRVIPGFMIQGGDPNGNGTGSSSVFGETFKDELTGKESYKRGALAMANRGPDTNGSQFFIMHNDYPLPPNYTIFGEVYGSMRAVDAIAAVSTDTSDRPETPVVISKVYIQKIGR